MPPVGSTQPSVPEAADDVPSHVSNPVNDSESKEQDEEAKSEEESKEPMSPDSNPVTPVQVRSSDSQFVFVDHLQLTLYSEIVLIAE